jgi:hypothetical protein
MGREEAAVAVAIVSAKPSGNSGPRSAGISTGWWQNLARTIWGLRTGPGEGRGGSLATADQRMTASGSTCDLWGGALCHQMDGTRH